MTELAGRTALVTGGAKGIGLAAAEELSAGGARVAVVDVDECPPVGPDGIAIVADLRRDEECGRAVAEAVAAFGRLDILVCSAGIQRYGDVVETSVETWDEVLAVNVSSVFHTAKAAVPHLRRTGDGAIVVVASVQSFVAQRGVAAYCASKGAVLMLAQAMAVDHAPEVRVNTVCPGSVDTPMLRGAAELFTPAGGDVEDTVASWGDMHPMGRVARPEEVAQAIRYLAGPNASFITGAALRVDGGLLSRLGGT
jgi:NAD(P)-dependent dehydrogenase (short-subunit alcohol dehydrogenase family)